MWICRGTVSVETQRLPLRPGVIGPSVVIGKQVGVGIVEDIVVGCLDLRCQAGVRSHHPLPVGNDIILEDHPRGGGLQPDRNTTRSARPDNRIVIDLITGLAVFQPYRREPGRDQQIVVYSAGGPWRRGSVGAEYECSRRTCPEISINIIVVDLRGKRRAGFHINDDSIRMIGARWVLPIRPVGNDVIMNLDIRSAKSA